MDKSQKKKKVSLILIKSLQNSLMPTKNHHYNKDKPMTEKKNSQDRVLSLEYKVQIISQLQEDNLS